MFAGLENVQANPRRGWTALVSFTLQAAAVAAALAIPLMYPNSLPDALVPRRIFVPVSSPDINPEPTQHQDAGGTSVPRPVAMLVNNNPQFRFIRPGQETGPTDPAPFLTTTGPGFPDALARTLNLGIAPPPHVRATVEAPPRISRAMQGYLIRRVEPRYPNLAVTTGVQGAVLIKAVISTEGRIEQAQVISGSPLLSGAALDAIKQWRYRPYLLNDRPVEVETEITVNFYLNR